MKKKTVFGKIFDAIIKWVMANPEESKKAAGFAARRIRARIKRRRKGDI